MNKNQQDSILEKIVALTKYLIEHPNDDQTIFHLCDTCSKTTAEALERFKKLKAMLKKVNGCANYEKILWSILIKN